MNYIEAFADGKAGTPSKIFKLLSDQDEKAKVGQMLHNKNCLINIILQRLIILETLRYNLKESTTFRPLRQKSPSCP